MADRRVWMHTHRTAGYVSVLLGLLIVMSGILVSRQTMPAVVGPASLAAAAIVVVSHIRYARNQMYDCGG
jgi:hypothetical protein